MGYYLLLSGNNVANGSDDEINEIQSVSKHLMVPIVLVQWELSDSHTEYMLVVKNIGGLYVYM